LVFNLNHKNLLIPKHFDEFEGSPYLVLPYCRQGSVFCKIGEVSEQELARFMQQASSALNYLHNQDPPIIHQDIKPDNFLIDGNGNYLLADFGISSKIRRTLTKSMGAQASTGTLAYMPPEKFSADKQIIKAGDIFSLGVAMYELLTGDLPFGDHGGMVMLTGAQVPNLPPSFNPELSTLLKHCMSKEPWERPTAGQLEDVAGKFMQTGKWMAVGKDVHNPAPEMQKELEQPREGMKTEPIPQRQPKPQTELKFEPEPVNKRNHTPWIIAAVLVAVGIVVAIFWTKGPSSEQLAERVRQSSIRIADSIAQVAAKEQRINDSISLVQRLSNDQNQKAGKEANTDDKAPNNVKQKMKNKALKIGDTYSGGIIFYLDKTGKHGKVFAAKFDPKDVTWDDAKSICSNLNLNGYNDWYLPSKEEIYEVHLHVSLPNFGNNLFNTRYWTSTEKSPNTAYFSEHADDDGNYHFRSSQKYNSTASALPIRAF
ncbi:MAG: protein kinase, partial [Bacteroidetes bacterium]|nr:protein kinase [Bacteroidota bacterium]